MGDAAGVVAASQATAGAAGAYSQIQSGRFNSKVHRFNAEVAQIQARDAVRRGEADVSRMRSGTKRLISAQRAGFAGQNVVVDQDVAGAVVAESETAELQDAETLRTNAKLEAWGFKVQETDSRMKAKIETYESRNRAAGTLLTSGAGAWDTYRRLKDGGK